MASRTDALAQLLETTLAERFDSPVVDLLAAIPVGLALLQAEDRRILTCNARMRAQFRLPAEQVAGTPISEALVGGHPMANEAPYRRAASSDEPFDGVLVIEGQPHRWFIRPLRGGQPRVQYLLVGLLEPVVPAGEEQLSRLRESNAVKTDFLNTAAHELRTPLGVIHGYGSMLAQGGLSPEHQRLAGVRIYEKAQQLSRLITDMSLVARLDELQPTMARQPLDLVAIVADLVKDAQRRWPDLAIELTLETARAPVWGSQEWLQLAIREVLENAARFRPGPTGRVDVTLRELDGGWVLSVVDDGMGIAATDRAGLFGRFARVETEENRHLVGLGIGLYLVREVTLAHGGRVEIDSRIGMGTSCTLTLPRSAP